jgi:hypothetical protein
MHPARHLMTSLRDSGGRGPLGRGHTKGVRPLCHTQTPLPHPEDRTVVAIQALGGRVSRDGQGPGVLVISLDLSSTKATATDLKGLATLKKLQWPALSQTKQQGHP